MQPAHMQGSMGPPQRPERAPDASELNDVLHNAGITLKEEEEFMANSYHNHPNNQTLPAQSFNSQASSATLADGSFGQGWQPGQHLLQGATQPEPQPRSQREIEDEAHKKAALEQSKRDEQSLNNPFLQSKNVRSLLSQRTYEFGLQLNVEGVYDPITHPAPGAMPVHYSIALVDSPIVELLSLLTLAAQERMRGLVEDAYALSRTRQLSSQGVVPPEWSTISIGENPRPVTAAPESITGTPWDKPLNVVLNSSSGSMTSHKRPVETSVPTPPDSQAQSPSSQPQPTVQYTSSLSASLQKLSRRDRLLEERRLKKREKRRSATAAKDASTRLTPDADEKGLIVPPEPKMTKKERDRLAKASQTEDVLHRNANATAAAAVGGLSKYSWMTGASAATSTNTLQAGSSRFGAGAGNRAVSSTAAGAPGGPEGLRTKDKAAMLGRWSEARDAKGIDIRDWLNVIEGDGKERKALAKAWLQIGKFEGAGLAGR